MYLKELLRKHQTEEVRVILHRLPKELLQLNSLKMN